MSKETLYRKIFTDKNTPKRSGWYDTNEKSLFWDLHQQKWFWQIMNSNAEMKPIWWMLEFSQSPVMPSENLRFELLKFIEWFNTNKPDEVHLIGRDISEYLNQTEGNDKEEIEKEEVKICSCSKCGKEFKVWATFSGSLLCEECDPFMQ